MMVNTVAMNERREMPRRPDKKPVSLRLGTDERKGLTINISYDGALVELTEPASAEELRIGNDVLFHIGAETIDQGKMEKARLARVFNVNEKTYLALHFIES